MCFFCLSLPCVAISESVLINKQTLQGDLVVQQLVSGSRVPTIQQSSVGHIVTGCFPHVLSSTCSETLSPRDVCWGRLFGHQLYCLTEIVQICLARVSFWRVKTNSFCREPVGSTDRSHGMVARRQLLCSLEQRGPLGLELWETELDPALLEHLHLHWFLQLQGYWGMRFGYKNGQYSQLIKEPGGSLVRAIEQASSVAQLLSFSHCPVYLCSLEDVL